jgi:hypothetical protein
MFELPSLEHVEKCLIDIDSAGKLSKPRLLSKSGQVIEISGLGGARSA